MRSEHKAVDSVASESTSLSLQKAPLSRYREYLSPRLVA